MKTFTKSLKTWSKMDLESVRLAEGRDEKPWMRFDRYKFYIRKWNNILDDVETPAQRKICLGMIETFENMLQNDDHPMEFTCKYDFQNDDNVYFELWEGFRGYDYIYQAVLRSTEFPHRQKLFATGTAKNHFMFLAGCEAAYKSGEGIRL